MFAWTSRSLLRFRGLEQDWATTFLSRPHVQLMSLFEDLLPNAAGGPLGLPEGLMLR
jgi:hypothetical protein